MTTYICKMCNQSFMHKKKDRVFCSMECYLRDRAIKPPQEVVAKEFWARVSVSDPSSCWLWTAGRISAGYGSFRRTPLLAGEFLAHRIAWALTYGHIPGGVEVCHNCPDGDNPTCVNPAHLFLGSHAENIRDAFAKGRMQDRDANPKCKGSRNGNSKLTKEAVKEIREAYATGGVTMKQLAERYGLSSPSTINFVLKGKMWKHVE